MQSDNLHELYKIALVKIVEIKSKIHDYDNNKIWNYTFPRVAATESQIISFEEKMKIQLPKMYRDFLLVANGWNSFFQYNDLLGIDFDIITEYYNLVNDEFFNLEEANIEGFNKTDLLPIAVNKFDKDIFFIDKSKTENNGMVIWFAGEMIEIWDNFKEFVISMISYNQRLLDQIEN